MCEYYNLVHHYKFFGDYVEEVISSFTDLDEGVKALYEYDLKSGKDSVYTLDLVR